MSCYDDTVTSIRDDLGECLRLQISTRVFPLDVVQRTAYWYTDDYYLFLDMTSDGNTIFLEFRNKREGEADGLDEVIKRFCNDLIDQVVRKQVKLETKEIEDIIVKRAFSEALSADELVVSHVLK